MASREQIFTTADGMRARGERVSVRRVIRELRDGGSPRDVTPLIREWRRERDYGARIDAMPVPPFLASRAETFAKEMWAAAQAEAAANLAREREEVADELRAEQETTDEVTAMHEAAEVTIERCRYELGTQATRIAELERSLADLEAREFWDRVMREIWEILPPVGTMSIAQIEPLISRDLVREAERHREEWSSGTLRKKMNVRVKYHNYFERDPTGTFRRRRR